MSSCKFCNLEFKAKKISVLKGFTEYCSLSCSAKALKNLSTYNNNRIKNPTNYYYRNKNNPEFRLKRLISQRKCRQKNPGKYASLTANREAAKTNRTPRWLTSVQHKEIENFYKMRPKGYHVDHVIPLQGKDVSGLHVPWNLQYLTISENCSKRNKLMA